MSAGPLAGVRVLEIASLAPAPFAVTFLADLGAETVRIDRAGAGPALPGLPVGPGDPLGRGRRSVALDLKHPRAAETVLRLVERADVLVEGFRPGVCERLGIGPEPCLARNPRLVYGRLTGWGQDGPWAQRAGHDLTYLAVSGALAPLGPADGPPLPPANYVADFGGGGMLLAAGVLAALLERERSGAGQVVDAAMAEGAGLLSAFLHGLRAGGAWSDRRGENLLDGSAPFYACYACSDGGHVAVAALEPRFFAELLTRLDLDPGRLPAQYDRSGWPLLRATLAEVFAGRPRGHWAELFEGSDACVAPVLTLAEAPDHPQSRARGGFVSVGGVRQPAPAPRLSRTPAPVPTPAPFPGEHGDAVLVDWGLEPAEVSELRAAGVVV